MSGFRNLFKKRSIRLSDCERQELEKAVADGASPNAVSWLANRYGRGGISPSQFEDAVRNSIYVTDLNYLWERFRPSGVPEGEPKEYPYPAAFYGAIFGDIAGSAYEGMYDTSRRATLRFENCILPESRPTDDTILSCATAIGDAPVRPSEREFAIRDFRVDSEFPFGDGNPFKTAYAECVRIPYENPSFGARFFRWATSDEHVPYGSLGNGSAARISALVDMHRDMRELFVRTVASAAVTHNHYEGIKGAIVTAFAAWMAYAGYGREQIFRYVKNHYSGTDNSLSVFSRIRAFTTDELFERDGPTVCSFSVPAAAVCFHESDCFEEVIDRVPDFDGDTDTIGAIAGTIAGAFYGVPDSARKIAEERNIGGMFAEAMKKITAKPRGI